MSQYETVNQEIGPLPITSCSSHSETLIINYTDDPIGVIDKYGSKKLVQPEASGRNNTIKIYVKSGIGNKTEMNLIKAHPGCICTINYRDIITEPMYVKEADILVCYYRNIDLFSHPNLSMSYRESVKHIFEELKKIDDVKIPTLKIMANSTDPNIDMLYVSVFNHFCSIKVTHYNTSDDGVSIIYPNDQMKMKFIPFEDIKKADGYVNTPDFQCFIALDKETLRKAIKREFASMLKYTEDDLAKMKCDLQKKLEAAVKEAKDSVKAKYDNELQAKLNRISSLENELASAKVEYESLKKLLNSADNFLNFTQKTMSHQANVMQNDTEKMKLFISIIKIVIPVALAYGAGKFL